MEKKRIIIDVLPQHHNEIKAHAARQGLTLRKWIFKALLNQMKKEVANPERITNESL